MKKGTGKPMSIKGIRRFNYIMLLSSLILLSNAYAQTGLFSSAGSSSVLVFVCIVAGLALIAKLLLDSFKK